MPGDERFDPVYIDRRSGDEFGGVEYRCEDCGEFFYTPYATSAVEYCPRCGAAEIEDTGLELVGPLQPSQPYNSWIRAKRAVEEAERRSGGDGSDG